MMWLCDFVSLPAPEAAGKDRAGTGRLEVCHRSKYTRGNGGVQIASVQNVLSLNKITSLQNQRIKEVIKLGKHAVRNARRQTVVEGLREASRALANGIRPLEVYLCPDLVREDERTEFTGLFRLLEQQGQRELFEVTPAVFAKLAYREASDGVLMVIPYVDRPLAALPLSESPFLCVIEGVEKPGNLGAILRTADAAGVDGVILCAGATDLHNPNVVRASLGTLFTVPVAEVPSATAIAWLQAHQIQIIAATPDGAIRYTDADLAGPVAIVMGSEAHGLSPLWRQAADAAVVIPMFGAADSLNLSTSTALLLYEVVRQRALNPHKPNR
jgi:TrmH family RNA methyltransferase